MKIRLASNLQQDSIVDGEGLRTVIWTQGCSHNCLGCHNPETHDFKGGFELDIEDLKEKIKNTKYQDGITLSGGDPFFQIPACLEIARYCHALNLNVWCYTGYTFEQLMMIAKKNTKVLEFLEQIDVLIDGRFDLSKKSLNVKFRGSTNQRIIDVKKSLELGYACVITKYDGSLQNDDFSINGIFNRKKEVYI
ncbi:MAG: anaerobic ribonucleoside-triphosphate reductase activating protein [Bacilli bacterium]|nr:anaerobic ribonucleoside-triphosphate reductase activating protein [Bacilli bacterium]